MDVSYRLLRYVGMTLFVVFAFHWLNLQHSHPAYIDHTLFESTQSHISVIVSGQNAQAAVEEIGGTVTSDLWLIDAVGATVPASQLDQLAAQPGIDSIVSNQAVSAADAPACAGGACSQRPGWITDRRERRLISELPVDIKMKTRFSTLPDGRFVAVAEETYVAFLTQDGTIETLIDDLDFEKMDSQPVVGADGSVYFAAEEQGDSTKINLFAINPDGTVRYIERRDKVNTQVVLSADGQYIYLSGNENRPKLYVFEAASGDFIDKVQPHDEKPGLYKLPPFVAPDGTVYLLSSGKEPDREDRRANLHAFDPATLLDGKDTYLWRFIAEDGNDLMEAKYQPLLNNGALYLATKSSNKLFKLDAATGVQQWVIDLPKEVKGDLVAASDGTLYYPADKHVYSIGADGSLRFDFVVEDKSFKLVALSADQNLLFAQNKERLYTVDALTGDELWSVPLEGDVTHRPYIDENGNVVAFSDEALIIARPTGQVTSRIAVEHLVLTGEDGEPILMIADEKKLVSVALMPESYDEAIPDAQPTELDDEWELSNPIAIDIGADVVHETERLLPNDDGELEPTPLTGAGVTIAVLDSGVYVDDKVKNLLSSDEFSTDIKKQFVGQYDFVGDGYDNRCKNSDYNALLGYCYYEWDKSHDDYGHGSHVAGIIWSQIKDYSSGVSMGIAPGAEVISIRVLDAYGNGTYEDVIEGIQFAVAGVDEEGTPFEHPIRILNLSLSAHQQAPYFVDPLNRAVEEAWAAGIVVLAAAGNEGDGAETVTVPGNDPYIITVGAINNQRTPGYWADDVIPDWSSSGPTRDGFIKPDVLAPGSHIVSFMHNEEGEIAQLLVDHPDYSETMSLFRMNGTSMATGVTSGVVALMLQANPDLTPDEVKYRMMQTAAPALVGDENGMELAYSPLRQGAGRVWAPAAVLADNLPAGIANQGLDLANDLAHPWTTGDSTDPAINPDLQHHYEGPVQKVTSDDGETILYYMVNPADDMIVGLGAAESDSMAWRNSAKFIAEDPTFYDGAISHGSESYVWGGASYVWSGASYVWSGASYVWSGASYVWSGASYVWSGASYVWSGASYVWSGASYVWGGASYVWGGASYVWGGASYVWSGTRGWSDGMRASDTSISSNKWIGDPVPEGFTVHSADLDIYTKWVSQQTWEATTHVSVRDEHNTLTADVLVSGTWSDGTTSECITASNGQCEMSVSINESVSSTTFELVSMSHPTRVYTPLDNIDYENDSDGNEIAGQRPIARPSLHVGAFDASSQWSNSSQWTAAVQITVADHNDIPLANATVHASWSNGFSGDVSCTTDASGQCTVAATAISDTEDQIRLTVNQIDHELNYYEDNDDVNASKINVSPPDDRPSLFIADIDASSQWISSTHWTSVITLTVASDLGESVENALISAEWSEDLSGSINCTTDANGQCVVTISALHEDSDRIRLTVMNIAHEMLYYDEDQNDDPDNDSNGEQVTVESPDYRPSMAVNQLTGDSVWIDDDWWQVTVTIMVSDEAGQPVAEVSVDSEWVRGISGDVSCTTSADGKCTVTALVPEDNNRVKLETLLLTHWMLIDADNHDDIQINRPK